jgi:tryptophanyl-tRNA synthetase
LIRGFLAPSRRVLSLRDPSSKMSKSSPDVQSRILLTDGFAQIKSKIRSAVTDSQRGIAFDPVNRPGISNIITILSTCTNRSPEDVAGLYAHKGHAQLKEDTAEAIEATLRQSREEFERLKSETGFLEEIAKDGARRAREISEVTMALVRSQIGLA